MKDSWGASEKECEEVGACVGESLRVVGWDWLALVCAAFLLALSQNRAEGSQRGLASWA